MEYLTQDFGKIELAVRNPTASVAVPYLYLYILHKGHDIDLQSLHRVFELCGHDVQRCLLQLEMELLNCGSRHLALGHDQFEDIDKHVYDFGLRMDNEELMRQYGTGPDALDKMAMHLSQASFIDARLTPPRIDCAAVMEPWLNQRLTNDILLYEDEYRSADFLLDIHEHIFMDEHGFWSIFNIYMDCVDLFMNHPSCRELNNLAKEMKERRTAIWTASEFLEPDFQLYRHSFGSFASLDVAFIHRIIQSHRQRAVGNEEEDQGQSGRRRSRRLQLSAPLNYLHHLSESEEEIMYQAISYSFNMIGEASDGI